MRNKRLIYKRRNDGSKYYIAQERVWGKWIQMKVKCSYMVSYGYNFNPNHGNMQSDRDSWRSVRMPITHDIKAEAEAMMTGDECVNGYWIKKNYSLSPKRLTKDYNKEYRRNRGNEIIIEYTYGKMGNDTYFIQRGKQSIVGLRLQLNAIKSVAKYRKVTFGDLKINCDYKLKEWAKVYFNGKHSIKFVGVGVYLGGGLKDDKIICYADGILRCLELGGLQDIDVESNSHTRDVTYEDKLRSKLKFVGENNTLQIKHIEDAIAKEKYNSSYKDILDSKLKYKKKSKNN